MELQYEFFRGEDKAGTDARLRVRPFSSQLLKWIGNKQRFAHEIISYFPVEFNSYIEPFLGSGAVLATLAPQTAVGSDVYEPLIAIFQTLKEDPELLKDWYSLRWARFMRGDRNKEYEKIKTSYNKDPNAADLLFISRSCYGGVIRFRKNDGYISTPMGPHNPISPEAFARRVREWHVRTSNASFVHSGFKPIMESADRDDMIYCDPPYSHTQPILYGAQSFQLEDLFDSIAECKARGVYVALSIDGTKRSGNYICDLPIPLGLFEREVMVNVGRSMLKRFQMNGKSLEGEVVRDRLLLTY